MGFSWKRFHLKRLYGLDQKTNIVDILDGFSPDLENVYQDENGVCSKRPGNEILFDQDETASTPIDEVGSATLSGTKYYFKFVSGVFKYATSRTGTPTTLTPSPLISTVNPIFWAVLDNKLFFVDGTNALRYFDGSSIRVSSIYQRPTVALSGGGAGTGYDYTYTIDNGLGESPASSSLLTNKGSSATVTISGNTGPQTLVSGDTVRIYSRATTIAAASKLVATYTWTASDVTAGTANIPTSAISDDQVQLYSELGVALNKTAPSGLQGVIVHYGRLVAWKEDFVYNSKVTNPHAWPDDSAQKEAFVYGFGRGDEDGDIQACVSFRESLFVLKKSKIAVFGGIGPDDTGNNAYSFRRLETNGLGCVAPKSCVVVGDQGESYLIYLSRLGFYATNGDDPERIGESVESNFIGSSESTLSGAVSFYHQRIGVYVCFVGGSTKTGWVLDIREDQGKRVGWFKWSGVNASSVFWDEDRYLFGTETGFCASERVSQGALDFSDVKIEYLAPAAINTGTDVLTVSGSYSTGDPVKIRSTGGVPGGLTANTTYYVIRLSATTLKLATSASNATLGTAINLTSQGSGTHSLVGLQAISAYYTTNWIHFGSPSVVKKVSKPSLILNALSSSVSITVKTAYDWVNSYGDPQTLSIGSSHLWDEGEWGSFIWGQGAVASPKNVAISRRKFRSIRYRFENSSLHQDFDLQGLEQFYDFIRNRGNAA